MNKTVAFDIGLQTGVAIKTNLDLEGEYKTLIIPYRISDNLWEDFYNILENEKPNIILFEKPFLFLNNVKELSELNTQFGIAISRYYGLNFNLVKIMEEVLPSTWKNSGARKVKLATKHESDAVNIIAWWLTYRKHLLGETK